MEATATIFACQTCTLIYPYAKKTIISIAIIDSPERIDRLKEQAQREFLGAPIRFDQESYSRFKKDPTYILWILPASAHKQVAIREFCQIKNINLKGCDFLWRQYERFRCF